MGDSASDALTSNVHGSVSKESTTERLVEIYTAIYEGAESFLKAEYTICGYFVVLFGALVFGLVTWGTGNVTRGGFTCVAFALGAVTSMVSGYLGMKVSILHFQNEDWSCTELQQ